MCISKHFQKSFLMIVCIVVQTVHVHVTGSFLFFFSGFIPENFKLDVIFLILKDYSLIYYTLYRYAISCIKIATITLRCKMGDQYQLIDPLFVAFFMNIKHCIYL